MKKIPTDSFTFKIVKKEGKNTVALNSRTFYQHFLNTKTKEGDLGTLTITLKKPTRSEAQLRYYWVIVGLIADYCGYNSEELHDALMKLKFGTKQLKVGKDLVEVRKSISNQAKFKKVDMMELLDFALEKANELEINVPNREELGYISN